MQSRLTADIEAKTRHYSVIYHDVLEAIPTANAVCLYLILLKFADNKTKTAHPSRSTLAKMMGYKSPQVADKAIEGTVVARPCGGVRTVPGRGWGDLEG